MQDCFNWNHLDDASDVVVQQYLINITCHKQFHPLTKSTKAGIWLSDYAIGVKKITAFVLCPRPMGPFSNISYHWFYL